MLHMTTRTYSLGMILLGFLLICSVQSAFGQDASAPASAPTSAPASAATTTSIANGEKARINGIITHSETGTITVRDHNGCETVVIVTCNTETRPKSLGCQTMCPGRCVRVEGRGNCDGHLVAEEIRFRRDDCNVCFFWDQLEGIKEEGSRMNAQLTAQQQALAAQAQALSTRVEENTITGRTARAEAQAAQRAADAANARISGLDDWQTKEELTVNFKTNKADLSAADKAALDQFAAKALATRGYMIVISGFTDSTGSEHFNNRLSDWRANAAMRYLVSVGKVPPERIKVTFPGGETMPVASNQTRHGRAENRRAVIKLLVSPALAGETLTQTSTDH
jgi:outer membrane protein OmpA-like peptidoglycan-associated protein